MSCVWKWNHFPNILAALEFLVWRHVVELWSCPGPAVFINFNSFQIEGNFYSPAEVPEGQLASSPEEQTCRADMSNSPQMLMLAWWTLLPGSHSSTAKESQYCWQLDKNDDGPCGKSGRHIWSRRAHQRLGWNTIGKLLLPQQPPALRLLSGRAYKLQCTVMRIFSFETQVFRMMPIGHCPSENWKKVNGLNQLITCRLGSPAVGGVALSPQR